ncbi:MAG: hypothetical protein JO299_17620, partial [Gammaproteobacteria bacterium]|nr:hypothetical protein [Gammaproteobacteria bacterium]
MRRPLRIAGWTAGALLGVLVLLVAGVWVAGNTAGGRAFLERALLRFSEGHVRVAGWSGTFPGAIDLEQLQLSDEHGVWLTAQGISLRWSPLALLARHVKVERLHFARLDIERRPVTQPSQKTTRTQVPHTDIDDASIDALVLGPELAGVRATLAVGGDAHLRSLTDAEANLRAHRSDAPGDYQLALRSDPARMDASLSLKEHAGGALANLLRLPALGEVSVEAKVSGPRDAARLHLDAAAGALTALAQGSLDLTRASADLDYRVEAPAMAPAEGLSWERIALQGHWQGPLSAARANAQLEVDGLHIRGEGGLKTLSAQMNADGGQLAVHALAEGLVIPGPQPKLLSDAPLRMDARVRLTEGSWPVELTADHRLFSLQAHAVSGTAMRTEFTLRLPNLTPLAAVVGQKVRGQAEIKGKLEQRSADTHLELAASTELANQATLLTALLSGTSHLQLAATMSERAIEVEQLAVKGQVLSASASGSAARGAAGGDHPLESLRARYEASLTNLGVVSPLLGGTLKLTGRVEGPLTSLASALQLTSTLSVRGSEPETIGASLEARGLPALTSATVQAHGELAGAPLALDAALDRAAGDAFHLNVRRAEWKSAHMEGDLTTAADMSTGHGGLRLGIARLEDLEPLLGTSLKGSVSGSLALRPGGKRTYTQLALDARNVIAAGIPVEARLSGSGTTEATDLQLRLQSANLRGEPADLESKAYLDLRSRELRLDQLLAHYHSQSLSLLSPAHMSFAEGFAVRGLKLGMQKAIVEVDGKLSPLDLRANARHIDADLIKAFMPGLLAQGSFDLEAQLTGTTSAPSGLVKLTGTQLRASSAQDLQPIDLHASAHLMETTAQLDVRLDGGHDSQLALTGTAPLDPQ